MVPASVPILKEKRTHHSTLSVMSDYVVMPPQILPANKYVTLSIGNLFFVDQVPFFATISDHIKFTTAEHILSRQI